jgi:peptidoglycan/LPS O-acetylase OafA/YrhL
LLKDDVSYGLYLYAWPIQNTIVYYDRTISPWVLTPVTLAGAAMLGFVSWRLIERPALALKRRIEPRRGSDALVTADAPGAG